MAPVIEKLFGGKLAFAALALAASISGMFCIGKANVAWAENNGSIANLKSLHSGKAGVYARVALKDQRDPAIRKVMLANPLLDCVVISAKWAELEPEEGKFDFSQLKRDISDWTATGKHVVVQVQLYGQSTDDRFTPAWLYKKKDVRAISFSGGGVAKGAIVQIPAVWDKSFTGKYVKPLVAELANQIDGDSHVWYIQPAFGHLGNLTPQPSKFGSPALKAAGWTADAWQEYCLSTANLYRAHFKRIPLIVASPMFFVKDRATSGYVEAATNLLKRLANDGMAIHLFDITADQKRLSDVYDVALGVSASAKNGTTRLGMGDDWPLWVQESRRDVAPTIGFDDEFFKTCLSNCFATANGKSLPTTMFYLNPPEILASSPISPQGLNRKDSQCYYRKDVAAILENARNRLLKNDEECFGK